MFSLTVGEAAVQASSQSSGSTPAQPSAWSQSAFCSEGCAGSSVEPQTFGTSGSRSFAVNRSLTIWVDSSSAAPTEPFGPPAVPIAR